MDPSQQFDESEEWPLPSSLVPESRKVTQITGIAPKSAILSAAKAVKEHNVRRAPPKEIPRRLRKEFISGKKNAAACLNEVCQLQGWTCKYEETTPSRTFGPYGNRLFAMTAIVDGYDYQAGEAKTKKEAKTAAAKHALLDILIIYEDELLGKGPQLQHDPYGRAVPVARTSISSSAASKCESFKPLPGPVVPQKSNFLPAPSSTIVTDQLGKMKIASHIFESVGAMAEKKRNELFSAFPAIAQSSLQGAVAMFIVKKAKYGEVVAVGSGDACYLRNERHNNGHVLFDCHAETIARRAFRRYLIQQIKLWHNKEGASSHEHCIFEKQTDSEKLCLKHTVTIHLYLTKPPKGIARSSIPVVPTSASHRTNDLSLVSLLNGGNAEEPLSSRKMTSVATPMACMSGSDKILKWTVCGVQGTVLSNFVAPIYLNSITVGCDMDTTIQCDPLKDAVITRMDPNITANLPDMYIVCQPKIDRYIRKFPKPDENPSRGQCTSANWTLGDGGLEVVDPYTGVVDNTASGVGNSYSRLSKDEFFHSCIKLSAYTHCKFPIGSYHTAKKFDKDYNKTKNILISYLKGRGFGAWLERGCDVDIFKQ